MKFTAKNFLTGLELSRPELLALLDAADEARLTRAFGSASALRGQTVALIFEKPSLRTRVSFSVSVKELGGEPLVIDSSGRKTEEPEDTIRVLGGYCHAAVVRTFAHANLERMAAVSPIPLINGLSDEHHPCQALADLLTLKQTYGSLQGVKLAYVGDGNNVLHSLLLLAPFVGVDLQYACPKGYAPDAWIVARARSRAAEGGGRVTAHACAEKAVAGAHAVYTDVWASMGFEDARAGTDEIFAPFALTEKLYAHAAEGALILHCLPMVRDKEIASALVEHPCSALFRQSENRLHAQKALLVGLLGRQAGKRLREGPRHHAVVG